MKDTRGVVLYVGKANNLRARVTSYFRAAAQDRPHIPLLLRRVAAIETTVTDTEKEALLLEHTLIRKHRPRYNIIFRDDKSYVSVAVNLRHPFPGIFRTRKVVKDGAAYFGPFPSGLACKETIALVTRFFRLRTCRDHEFANRARPCLQYQIGRCTAPCVGFVAAEVYRAQVARALLLLKGQRNELTAHVEREMRAQASGEHFEEAARLRDLLRDVRTTIESQKVIRHGAADADFFGWAEAAGHGAVAVLERRNGHVGERGGAAVVLGGDAPASLLASYLLQYYQPPRVPPAGIYLPFLPASAAEIGQLLTERRGHAVRLCVPRRGESVKLVHLAATNAAVLCERRREQVVAGDHLTTLVGKALHLSGVPSVIECVDISNWQGDEAVAALVCFVDGTPAKQRYRHYKIQGPHEPNDYAMMHEVLARRLTGDANPPWPDLLLVDGGKGQLQVAVRVLQELGAATLSLAAIAKPREGEPCDKIYLPGRKNPLPLRAGDPVLLLLQRLRDETHRFAITFHRKRFEKVRGAV
ncbi:MAG: excinuclease ABC subunit UvrC [Deltaproteobacteria bacterium]|nr:excinuclease ABC subunit UvrC [Deltaproteobacteria bacterium]